MRLATGTSWFFYGYLLLGIALFLYFTLTTKIETEAGAETLFYAIFFKAGGGALKS